MSPDEHFFFPFRRWEIHDRVVPSVTMKLLKCFFVYWLSYPCYCYCYCVCCHPTTCSMIVNGDHSQALFGRKKTRENHEPKSKIIGLQSRLLEYSGLLHCCSLWNYGGFWRWSLLRKPSPEERKTKETMKGNLLDYSSRLLYYGRLLDCSRLLYYSRLLDYIRLLDYSRLLAYSILLDYSSFDIDHSCVNVPRKKEKNKGNRE